MWKTYKYKGALLRHRAREHFDTAAEESFLVRATAEIVQFQDILVGETVLDDEVAADDTAETIVDTQEGAEKTAKVVVV